MARRSRARVEQHRWAAGRQAGAPGLSALDRRDSVKPSGGPDCLVGTDDEPLPAGTVTFLLTDVAGSTAPWRRRWRATMRCCERRLYRTAASNRSFKARATQWLRSLSALATPFGRPWIYSSGWRTRCGLKVPESPSGWQF